MSEKSPDQPTATEGMIEAGAKAMHDDPPPPAMSAIDWLETPNHIRERLRHSARVCYQAMEAIRAGR